MKIIENKFGTLLLAGFAMVFFSNSANAQNEVQKEQQQTNKVQRFVDVDTNRDGLISKAEFQSDAFDKFDADQNGVLSRSEYREINRSIVRAQGNISNQGNRQNKNNNAKKGNGQGKGLGTCPNGGKKFAKKNCKPKGKGKF